jgi:hypothetical protein
MWQVLFEFRTSHGATLATAPHHVYAEEINLTSHGCSKTEASLVLFDFELTM